MWIRNWGFDRLFPLSSFPDDSAVTKCGVAHELVSPKTDDDATDDDNQPPQVAYSRPWHVSLTWVSMYHWFV